MGKLFGTDGVRGKANEELTPELAMKLGEATSNFARKGEKVFIGRDTRRSGGMFKSALESGMASHGLDVIDLGIVPTPAVPFLGKEKEMDLGAVISASHNLAGDNGIKFFDSRGFKIPIAWEEKIENFVFNNVDSKVPGREIGQIYREKKLKRQYVDRLLKKIVPKNFSTGLKLVIDCANGANYKLGPLLFDKVGVDTTCINTEPNGDNINLNCGSTNMESISRQIGRASCRERVCVGV